MRCVPPSYSFPFVPLTARRCQPPSLTWFGIRHPANAPCAYLYHNDSTQTRMPLLISLVGLKVSELVSANSLRSVGLTSYLPLAAQPKSCLFQAFKMGIIGVNRQEHRRSVPLDTHEHVIGVVWNANYQLPPGCLYPQLLTMARLRFEFAPSL